MCEAIRSLRVDGRRPAGRGRGRRDVRPRRQAMIQGLAFMSHQIGSFLGAYGGGVLYDALGSYTMAWRTGVALGLAGGIIQVAFALIRPSQPPAPVLRTA